MLNLPELRKKVYRRVAYGLIAMTMVIGIGAATAQPSEAGWLDLLVNGVRVFQLSNMSDSQEVDLGAGINRQLVESGQISLFTNESLNSYVNEIGQTLAQSQRSP